MEKPGLYIHVPFCRRKCLYCAFFSVAAFDAGRVEDYRRALCHEARNQVVRYFGGDDGLAYLLHSLFEKFPVLGFVYRLGIGAYEPYARPFQKPAARQLHGKGQPRLPAQPRKHGIGFFLFYNAL